MNLPGEKLQRTGGLVFILAALGLLLLAVIWPPEITGIFHSRLIAGLLAIWSGGFALVLHPEWSARIALGVREFRKALSQVIRELRGDDNDDGPSAV